jgi:Mn-dependent DtxR family transcriptional regulator
MEHIFDTDMIDTICERMGAPTKCPHGNVIPKCKRSECPVTD